jgi:L,D-transpeptidase YcbB
LYFIKADNFLLMPTRTDRFFLILLSLVLFSNCKNNNTKPPEKDVVPVAKLSERTTEDIQRTLEFVKIHQGQLNDSVSLSHPELADSVYAAHQYHALWMGEDKFLPAGIALFHFIDQCRLYGLFPADYHWHSLAFVQRVFAVDTNAMKDATIWARTDLLLTDAFFLLAKDLKRGRLPFDSTTLRKDSLLPADFYANALNTVLQGNSVEGILNALEPRYRGYDSIKAYIGDFLSKAHFMPYTRLTYPYPDSVAFFDLDSNAAQLDSNGFKSVVRKYQKKYNFRPTGRVSDPLVDKLNNTDLEKFRRIAINLDRYKLLPDSLPAAYIWVNLPSFMLEVYDGDTLVFQSRVIVGGAQTRTPVLTSEISNFITMPQWTVPYSIIFKEMLPKIQENVDFLAKQNLLVIDDNDSVLDPHTINWDKLNKTHFPYQLKQKEGDDNSLGVIKFNFRNKYSVYLHDTNVRWKFNSPFRAISHGCVRVKEWAKLANYLVRTDTLKYPTDTLRAWIKRQEKHTVSGFPKVPVFLRYFTCEGKDGQIRFYGDIYEDDRYLVQKYFANKNVE